MSDQSAFACQLRLFLPPGAGEPHEMVLHLLEGALEGPDPHLGSISLELSFRAPDAACAQDLFDRTCLVQTEEDPLVVLDLEFVPGEEPEEATLWLPGYARPARLSSLRYSAGGEPWLELAGSCVDASGELSFGLSLGGASAERIRGMRPL